MSLPSWLLAEPGVVTCSRQLQRLARRAMRRARTTASLSVLFCLVATGAFVVKERTFEPRVILRVVEADRDSSMAPRPKRRLRDHVWSTVFTSASLQEVMRKHDLYPSLSRTNPRAALDSFREDIVVDVYRNYFIEERSASDPPRSARIAISYRSENPALAVLVARDLGALVAAHESKRRQRQAGLFVKGAVQEAAFARDMLLARQHELSVKSEALQRHRSDKAWLEVLSLGSSLRPLEAELDRAERMQAEVEFGAAIEAGGLGLRFDVVDNGAVGARFNLTALRVVEAAFFALILLTPFAGLLVGAFSNGIDDEDDVERLGLHVIGTLVPSGFERGGR